MSSQSQMANFHETEDFIKITHTHTDRSWRVEWNLQINMFDPTTGCYGPTKYDAP